MLIGMQPLYYKLCLVLVDNTVGNYGGAGMLIERPDWVIKHALVQQFGIPVGDINAASFTAAGSFFTTNSYAFGFCITSKLDPKTLLQQLAAECRATLIERNGAWYLNVIPDTAPAATRTLSYQAMATEPVFSDTNITDLKNDLAAGFKLNYESNRYEGAAVAADAASKTKYGTYIDNSIELKFIRSQAMADSLLALRLKLQKQPYKRCSLAVLWDQLDLNEGDTFELSSATVSLSDGRLIYPLFGGRKFFVEKKTMEGKATAKIEAVEWW